MPTDAEIARLAGRQHGFVTRAQLNALGIGRGAIESRVDTGRLIRVHRGVYAVGHRRTDPAAVAHAALLACGERAVLSHSTAAFLWGLIERFEAPVEVTVAGNRRPPRIRVHRSETLARQDVRSLQRMRITAPARTLLDIAPRLDERALARAVNEARNRLRMRLQDLAELLARHPARPGAPALRRFAAVSTGATRSPLEDAFEALAAKHRLPAHEVNHRLNGATVDILFPEHRLIVELDSRGWHDDPLAFEVDRRRDAAALASGYATLRVTHRRLTEEAAEVMAQLKRILRERGASGGDGLGAQLA